MSAVLGDRVREACVTVLGSGYAPVASGTFGSAASVVIYLAAYAARTRLGVSPFWFDVAAVLPVAALACVLGVALGPWAIARYGRKDPKPFVLDEFAGQWTALLFMPAVMHSSTFGFMLVVGGQFFLFRLLDVIKPPPANWIDRDWRGGWGITFDDVVAGIYANLIGQLLWRIVPLTELVN